MPTKHPIIFYDGVCGLCNSTVQFIIRHDKQQRFRFATLQSGFAADTLKDKITLDSFIYYNNEKPRFYSTGALFMFRELGGWWALLFVFILVPPFIRNATYRWVARNRYRWFGKLDACPVPSAEQKALFLDIL